MFRDIKPVIKFMRALSASIILIVPVYGQQTFDDFLAADQRAYEQFEQRQQQEYQQYIEDVLKKWNEFNESTKRDWYDYSDDLETFSKVDFQEGKVTIETLVESDETDVMAKAGENIKKQVESLLQTDEISEHRVLENQVKFKSGEEVKPTDAVAYVEQEVMTSAKIEPKKVTGKDGVKRTRVTASFNLVPDHLRVRAEKYLPLVRKYSKRYSLQVPLVMAMMQTESYFNPRAKSAAPAYGLMQLVPKSGGREAYKFAFKVDKIVKPGYLYNPENNIHLGCAYLARLRDVEFRRVEDANNQRYCIIASYNTGPGNLSRAITGNRDVYSAVDRINRLTNEKLFDKLKNDLPYAETRDYLVKVETRQENYREWQ